MPTNKNYIALHNAWDKSTMAAIGQLRNDIEYQVKDLEILKERIALNKKELALALESWRIAKADHNKYLKANK